MLLVPVTGKDFRDDLPVTFRCENEFAVGAQRVAAVTTVQDLWGFSPLAWARRPFCHPSSSAVAINKSTGNHPTLVCGPPLGFQGTGAKWWRGDQSLRTRWYLVRAEQPAGTNSGAVTHPRWHFLCFQPRSLMLLPLTDVTIAPNVSWMHDFLLSFVNYSEHQNQLSDSYYIFFHESDTCGVSG